MVFLRSSLAELALGRAPSCGTRGLTAGRAVFVLSDLGAMELTAAGIVELQRSTWRVETDKLFECFNRHQRADNARNRGKHAIACTALKRLISLLISAAIAR